MVLADIVLKAVAAELGTPMAVDVAFAVLSAARRRGGRTASGSLPEGDRCGACRTPLRALPAPDPQAVIASQTPGRVRIRLPAVRGSPPAAAAIAGRLERLAGVQQASANALTGSVLVRFDPHRTDSARILGALVDPLPPAPTEEDRRGAPRLALVPAS